MLLDAARMMSRTTQLQGVQRCVGGDLRNAAHVGYFLKKWLTGDRIFPRSVVYLDEFLGDSAEEETCRRILTELRPEEEESSEQEKLEMREIHARKMLMDVNDYDYGRANNKHDPPPKGKPGGGGKNA
ncbi:hypothetical protein KSP39_PZI005598 [Platanthera zijinensis]|uniref:Uncharacterized protein n=1 Tax=Platanthera zijinensis TaxID=2320716 RepID=A0AAP0BTG9_9ASPA